MAIDTELLSSLVRLNMATSFGVPDLFVEGGKGILMIMWASKVSWRLSLLD